MSLNRIDAGGKPGRGRCGIDICHANIDPLGLMAEGSEEFRMQPRDPPDQRHW